MRKTKIIIVVFIWGTLLLTGCKSMDYNSGQYEETHESLQVVEQTNNEKDDPELIIEEENIIEDEIDQVGKIKELAEGLFTLGPSSRSYLINLLEGVGYNREESALAIDSLEVDWNEQAVNMAIKYLGSSSFSRPDLISQLEYEEFTREEVIFAMDAIDADIDWSQHAIFYGEIFLKFKPYSRSVLIDDLVLYYEFTAEEASSCLDLMDVDWNDQAKKKAIVYLEEAPYSGSDLIDKLEEDGFTRGEAIYGAETAASKQI